MIISYTFSKRASESVTQS